MYKNCSIGRICIGLRAGNRVDELNGGLIALQNRYREMEAEIRLTQDDSVQTIKMQREKILKIRQDNNRVKSELQLETNQVHKYFSRLWVKVRLEVVFKRLVRPAYLLSSRKETIISKSNFEKVMYS